MNTPDQPKDKKNNKDNIKNTESVVYGRDGRQMHPNSIKALENNRKPQWVKGQSGNPNGRDKSSRAAEKYFKDSIRNIMLKQSQNDDTKTEMDVFTEEIRNMAKTTKSEAIKLKIWEMFKDSIDGKPAQHQNITSESGILSAGIMLIPPKNGDE
jgi:hypothetical protein